jgi:RNA recognition motif-containing protein
MLVFDMGRGLAGRERILGMKLYVGNLSYGVNDSSLRALFEAHGSVQSATVVVDRDSGRSKGFGFVEMGDEDAKKAMQALNGSQHDGRTIRVNEARPKNP